MPPHLDRVMSHVFERSLQQMPNLTNVWLLHSPPADCLVNYLKNGLSISKNWHNI